MAGSEWEIALEPLGTAFPLFREGEEFPNLSAAIDDGLDNLLRDTGLNPSPANPLYVEDLLQDCIHRISNCLILREKAQEVELRAIAAATSYKSIAINLKSQEIIQKALGASGASQGSRATGGKIAEDGKSFSLSGDAASWNVISEESLKLFGELQSINEISRIKSGTEGNGSNFAERFSFLKRMFDLNMVEAFRRIKVCEKALKSIYGIDLKVPTITAKGYLDQLSLWTQQASNGLDETLDQRLYSDVVFAAKAADESPRGNEVLPLAQFTADLTDGKISFKLNTSHFDNLGMQSPLLRSIRLQVGAKERQSQPLRLWPCQVTLPQGTLSPRVPKFPCIATNSYFESPEDEVVVRGVHNIDPRGDWEIALDTRSLTGDTLTADVMNFFIFMRVSYRR